MGNCFLLSVLPTPLPDQVRQELLLEVQMDGKIHGGLTWFFAENSLWHRPTLWFHDSRTIWIPDVYISKPKIQDYAIFSCGWGTFTLEIRLFGGHLSLWWLYLTHMNQFNISVYTLTIRPTQPPNITKTTSKQKTWLWFYITFLHQLSGSCNKLLLEKMMNEVPLDPCHPSNKLEDVRLPWHVLGKCHMIA